MPQNTSSENGETPTLPDSELERTAKPVNRQRTAVRDTTGDSRPTVTPKPNN